MNKIWQIFTILAATGFMVSCSSSGGGTHITIAVQGDTQSTAIVYYVDSNCSSLSGMTIVGSTYELCPDATVVEDIFSCADIPIGFSQLNGATDVTLSPASVGTNFQILNDCRGIMSGNLNGETGSCLLATSNDACECQVNTNVLATAHNSEFAARVTAGIAILRAVTDSAKDKVFEGLADPDQAEFEERGPNDGPNYRFDCSLF